MTQTRNLDLHSLECLDALLRERSVTRAAERIGISQSAMSETLARLRERFGDPLLVRTRDGMAPTPLGESIVADLRRVIDDLRSLVDRAHGFDPATSNERFRITASDYTQLLLMPQLLDAFERSAPRCRVEVRPVNIARLEEALDGGEVDLAIAYHPHPPPGLRRSRLATDRYVCIARRGHAAVAAGLGAADFAALRHVSVAPSGLTFFSGIVDSALEGAGLTRRVDVSSPHFLLAAHLVSQSDLVLALPRRAALVLAGFLPIETFEIPLPLETIETAMYWHERSHHAKPQEWLRGQVRAVLGAPSAAPLP